MNVFRTESDFPYEIHILGVGTLLPEGKNAIDVEHASHFMSELVEKDEYGQVKRDDQGGHIPLTGKALAAAAKEWADRINGVEFSTLKADTVEKMRAAGQMRLDHTAEDTLASAEYYAQKSQPAITTVNLDTGQAHSEVASAEEAMDAVGNDLVEGGIEDGGEG